jgi:hypothetical protein
MSENLHLYDLALSSLKVPPPPPWTAKYGGGGSNDSSKWVTFILDHPDFGALLEVDYRHYDEEPEYSSAYIIGFRKDRTGSTVDDMYGTLTQLFTPGVVLYRDYDRCQAAEAEWLAFWDSLWEYWRISFGFEVDDPRPPDDFPLRFYLKPAEEPVREPECLLTGPDLLQG